MTSTKQIEIARQVLKGGIARRVYHNCQMIINRQNQRLYAAYKQGEQFLYAGVDDTKGLFAYIRTNGDISATYMRVSSCEHSYTILAPLRVVFFADNEDRDFSFLTTKLAEFTFLKDVQLLRVIDDKWKLQREESDMQRPAFDGKTFYVAFDVLVKDVLLRNDCETVACFTEPNPLCL